MLEEFQQRPLCLYRCLLSAFRLSTQALVCFSLDGCYVRFDLFEREGRGNLFVVSVARASDRHAE